MRHKLTTERLYCPVIGLVHTRTQSNRRFRSIPAGDPDAFQPPRGSGSGAVCERSSTDDTVAL
jgi:hypothetical protein